MNNCTIDQSSNIIAKNNSAIVQNSNTSAQSSNVIAEIEFSLVPTDTPEETFNYIYTLKCSGCTMDTFYVGKTPCIEQECYNKIITNEKSAVYKHMQDAGHAFKIDDMQKVFSCCEYNKLKILESLLIKRYIVRNVKVLNTKAMKELTLFQYTEADFEKAKKQLTEPVNRTDTDRLGIARSNEIILHEFKESNDCKIRNNDTQLTLLQAEFENFYDITQEYIKENAKKKYITYLRERYNEIADSQCNQSQSWTKVVIGNRKHTKSSSDGTVETSGQVTESNTDSIGETSGQVTESNPDGNGETSGQVTESNPDGTGETSGQNTNYKQQHLAIELPTISIESPYNINDFKDKTREFLKNNIKTGFELEITDLSQPISSNIIYWMRCAEPECDRNLYIGLTERGHEARFDEHMSATNYEGKENGSAVYQHIKDTGHSFRIGDIKILEVCCDNNKLHILESLYIKKYLLNKKYMLNKKTEKHHLTLYAYADDKDLETAEKYLNPWRRRVSKKKEGHGSNISKGNEL